MDKIENPIQLEEFWKKIEEMNIKLESGDRNKINEEIEIKQAAYKKANPKGFLGFLDNFYLGRRKAIEQIKCDVWNGYTETHLPAEINVSPEIAYVLLQDHVTHMKKVYAAHEKLPSAFQMIKMGITIPLATMFPNPFSTRGAAGDIAKTITSFREHDAELNRINAERDKITGSILAQYELQEQSSGEYALKLGRRGITTYMSASDKASYISVSSSIYPIGVPYNFNAERLTKSIESKLGRGK